jgi:hypothetical protein
VIKTKVVGLRELQAECMILSRELEAVEEPAAMAAGEPIRSSWEGNVPVYEGHYRDALAVVWDRERRKAAVGTQWVPGLDREEQPFIYAARLEYGDASISAQPSARPALKAARKQALDAAAGPLSAKVRGRRPRVRV